MAFDLKIWKDKVREKLHGWRPRMEWAGVNSVYAFLSAATLWPVVEAARANEWAALAALGGVAAGVGTNLVANRIQGWKDEAAAAQQITAEIAENPELRAELDLVLEKLETVTQAGLALAPSDCQWFTETLHAELEHFGNLGKFKAVLKGSGAIAQGNNAKAAGEAGVVADKIKASTIVTGGRVVRAKQYIENQQVYSDPAQAKAAQAQERYLKRLRQRCNVLPLAALGGDEETGEEISLEQVYVALDTRTRVQLSGEERAVRQKAFRPAEDRVLEAATQNKRLALLGEAGSGKSTFVRQLAAWLASVCLKERKQPPGWEPDLVPVLIVLRDLASRLSGLTQNGLSDEELEYRLVEAFRKQWESELKECRAGDFAEELEEALTNGKVALIFDGLDEVPEGVRPRIRQAVGAVLRIYPALRRVIVTSRIRAYAGAAVLPDFPAHTLAPFDDKKISQFVAAWYQAQVALGRIDECKAQAKIQDLQSATLSAALRELAANPMLLTTMAIIHQREVGLPRERVRLYFLAVQVLLSRWQKRIGFAVTERLETVLSDDLKMRNIMERLAYEAHRRQASRDQGADLSRRDLLVLLEEPEYLDDIGLADEFLDYVDQRAGLLVGRGGDAEGHHPQTYTFPHRTFQEYLAGCYMVGRRGLAREYWQRLDEGDYWYLAGQLGAEELLYNRRNTQTLLDLAYELCPTVEPQKESAWRAALWSGQMAVLLGQDAIRRDGEKPEGGEVYLQCLILHLVDVLRQSTLGAMERAEAGRTLSKLGDLRQSVMTIEGMEFCHIPAGPFRMGKSDEEHLSQTLRYDYWISRYPVTNAQFNIFVEDDGYREARYWAEAERDGIQTNGRVKGWYNNESRPGPVDYGEPYNLPNHFAVGVIWYEAVAFARWLTERLRGFGGLPAGWAVQLPNDAEWEKAARGGAEIPTEPVVRPASAGFVLANEAVDMQSNTNPGRRYPWGNEPDPNRANYEETGIGTISAAGCFPDGASPYGVEDLCGNVWEWTRSLYGDYPYPVGEKGRRERENLQTGRNNPHVLRGGSFLNNEGLVRCAVRSIGIRDKVAKRYGFRVVLSPL